jgi:hypothetical protein
MMADFNRSVANSSAADMAAGNPGINMGTSGSMHEVAWGTEGWGQAHDAHWQTIFGSRPYAKADRGYEHYRPAYRYGTEASLRHQGREWNEVESDLERGWTGARGDSTSAWHDVKDAVRDAWDHVRGRGGR